MANEVISVQQPKFKMGLTQNASGKYTHEVVVRSQEGYEDINQMLTDMGYIKHKLEEQWPIATKD